MRRGVLWRLTWLISLASLIPLLTVGGVATLISYSAARQSARQQQAFSTNLVADDISRQLILAEDELAIFGKTLIASSDLFDITNDRIYPFLLSNPLFAEISLYQADGQLQASAFRHAPSRMPQSMAGSPLFEEALNGKTFYVDPLPPIVVAPPAPPDIPRLRLSLPLRQRDEIRLILVADVSMDHIWNLGRHFEEVTGSRILIATASGRLISASNMQVLIDAPLLPLPQESAATYQTVIISDDSSCAVSPCLASAAQNHKLLIGDYRSIFGDDVLGTMMIIEPTGWWLVLEHPSSLIYADVYRLAFSLLIVTLAVATISALLGRVTGRRIARPIQQLHAGVEAFGRNPRHVQPVIIHTRDELAALAEAFNTMAQGMRESQAQLAAANEELEQRVVERTAELATALHAVEQREAALEQTLAEVHVLAARLERSNRALQDFATVASHDLQEPLRKIQTFGDRLHAKYAGQLGDDGRDYLARMQHASGRMQKLIHDLLAYARVTTKAQPFVPVDLAQIAREVASDLEGRIAQVGGQVVIGSLPTVDADALQMRQLLQNVIGNALKFHREGVPPLVKVRSRIVSRTDADGDMCRISIEDNGIGFDEKYVDRIFQAFQRLHGQQAYEGTGIGLAVCRKIVERHGGSITATSQPGQGTTFIIVLPLRQPGDAGVG